MINILLPDKSQKTTAKAVLFTKENPDYDAAGLKKDDIALLKRFKEANKAVVPFYRMQSFEFFQFLDKNANIHKSIELARRAGAQLAAELRSHKIKEVILSSDSKNADFVLAYAEGLALGSYQFAKYKKEVPENHLQNIYIDGKIKQSQLTELQAVINGTFIARDLVNMPASHLSAEQLSEEIRKKGQEAGFKVEVLNKTKIESLKMGGLLSVAAGSIDPPTFNILEWNPKNAKNKKPIIFVGKGVIFDTGGLTLKPTPNSMDLMKSDMAGAAAVIGAFTAIAEAKLPYYVVGLIPATDNRPGERATAPGDVITMYNGTTVEVLNTDAEGRIILGDALHYAKKYKPELVIDLATLTGAAARAIGQYGIVFMSNADSDTKQTLVNTGDETYERTVEFPLWDEYADLLKSDIADLKNVASGQSAGAITAGKFLEHFVDYPWIHLDIAGSAFIPSADSYRSKNATGIGVRLLFKFLTNRYANA
jgi:leucyl aminopeptidase